MYTNNMEKNKFCQQSYTFSSNFDFIFFFKKKKENSYNEDDIDGKTIVFSLFPKAEMKERSFSKFREKNLLGLHLLQIGSSPNSSK